MLQRRKKEHLRRSYKARLNFFSRKLTRLFERGGINLGETFDGKIVNVRFYLLNEIKTYKSVKDSQVFKCFVNSG
jgi:hypothetical protein